MRDLNELRINEGGAAVIRPAPSENQLKEFQDRFKLFLPKEYIELLRYSNGGSPELDCFRIKRSDSNESWGINRFYHLDDDKHSHENLWKATEDWQKVLGASIVPIADDGGGNQICLDMSNNGEVFLCLHDYGFKKIGIAQSFVEFIDLLEEDPDMI
ncbi:MAG: SMI1/KNR4 family protein [Desulfobacterales bacterium]|nr:SMI1/KNR4 family protein [Desulfobacterales bacterium]